MRTVPTSLTEEQFDEHIRPYLNTAKRGYECKIPLYKVFNYTLYRYTLYRLHTGCQWGRLPIDADPDEPEKKKSAIMPFTTISASGAGMATWKRIVPTRDLKGPVVLATLLAR